MRRLRRFHSDCRSSTTSPQPLRAIRFVHGRSSPPPPRKEPSGEFRELRETATTHICRSSVKTLEELFFGSRSRREHGCEKELESGGPVASKAKPLRAAPMCDGRLQLRPGPTAEATAGTARHRGVRARAAEKPLVAAEGRTARRFRAAGPALQLVRSSCPLGSRAQEEISRLDEELNACARQHKTVDAQSACGHAWSQRFNSASMRLVMKALHRSLEPESRVPARLMPAW